MQESVTKLKANDKSRRMAKFRVQTNFEIYSTTDWKRLAKFFVEMTDKRQKLRVHGTNKLILETTEQTLKNFFVRFLDLLTLKGIFLLECILT